jgi:hypothetical protein
MSGRPEETPTSAEGNEEEELELEAETWLVFFDVPMAAGGKDLDGRVVDVCSVGDEATCGFFFSDRTFSLHLKMTERIVSMLEQRGATVRRGAVTIEDYARWQQFQGVDSKSLRYMFATRLPV